MLDGIVSALLEDDPRRAVLSSAAGRHRAIGLAAVAEGPYAATHWLGSFAVYLATRRGIDSAGHRPLPQHPVSH
jgi:hypothetical protein